MCWGGTNVPLNPHHSTANPPNCPAEVFFLKIYRESLIILLSTPNRRQKYDCAYLAWRGPESKAAEYYQYLIRTGVADYQATPGNRGVYILQRTAEGKTHFLLLTFWDSYEAIRKFAGEDVERARYYPEDLEYLLELEPFVTHYQVSYGPDRPGTE